jgi:hypothetical protein
VTIICSVVRNVLLDPFPYSDSRRMVDVVVRDASNRIPRGALPAARRITRPSILNGRGSRRSPSSTGSSGSSGPCSTRCSPRAVVTLIVGIGLCACWVPARCAVRIEPIAALRHE